MFKMISDETYPHISCNESLTMDNTIQNLNSSGFSNASNDEVFVNQTLPPKYMESLMMRPVLENNESFRNSQSSVRIHPPRAASKKRAQSCQNLKYSHVPSKVKKFIEEIPKESRNRALIRHKSMPESALPWNQLADNPFKDETDINVLKQELCKKIYCIDDLEQKIQDQSIKLTELGLEMGLKRAEMNLKVNSIRNELSIYKEKEQKNSRTQSTPSVHSKLGGTSRTFQDTSTQTEAVLLANPELPSRSTGNTPKIMMYTYKNKQEKRVEFDYINKNHSLIRELSYNQSDDDARHNNSTFQRSVTFNTSVMQNTTVFSSHASSENLIVEGMGIEDSTQLSDQEHDVTASIRNNESKRSKRSKIKKRLMNWICISK